MSLCNSSFVQRLCISGVAAALLLDRGLIDLDAPIAEYWPEFAAAGKERVTVRIALSHQAGLISVEQGATLDELLAHKPLANKLAAQRPYWPPGTAHGYHGTSVSVIIDELVRRTTGMTLAEFYTSEIRIPYEVDTYLGFPEIEEHRLVSVHSRFNLSPEVWLSSRRGKRATSPRLPKGSFGICHEGP